MSGENESQKPTIDTKHEKIKSMLDNYSIQVGLGKLLPSNEVEKFLNMSQAEIRRLTPEDCGEGAYMLGRSATYIQLEINRIQADINWCNTNIDFIVAKRIDSVGSQYTPYEYRRTLAIRQDDVAMKLQEIIVMAKLRVDAMSFIPNQLRSLANTFERLQQDKRNQR